jgi:hypothetical protein
MKFKDLFEDVEEWFWKLESNPETGLYELYLGVPNDWMYSGNGKDVSIDLFLEMSENSIIKISALDDSLTIDDIIDTAKLLVSKNKDLEKRKEEHRLEMERLKDLLIEKEKNFLNYIDTVKDTKGDGIVEEEEEVEVETEGTNEGVSEGVNDGEEVVVEEPTDKLTDDFMKDIGKSK